MVSIYMPLRYSDMHISELNHDLPRLLRIPIEALEEPFDFSMT